MSMISRDTSYAIRAPSLEEKPPSVTKWSLTALAVTALLTSYFSYSTLIQQNSPEPFTGTFLLMQAKVITVLAFTTIPVGKILTSITGQNDSTAVATFAPRSKWDFYRNEYLNILFGNYTGSGKKALEKRERLRDFLLSKKEEIKKRVDDLIQKMPPEVEPTFQEKLWTLAPYFAAIIAILGATVCYQQSLPPLTTFGLALGHMTQRHVFRRMFYPVTMGLIPNPFDLSFYELVGVSDFYNTENLTDKEIQHLSALLSHAVRDITKDVNSFKWNKKELQAPTLPKKERSYFKTTAKISLGLLGLACSYAYSKNGGFTYVADQIKAMPYAHIVAKPFSRQVKLHALALKSIIL
ncbi:MAG: hypothetical protein SNF33_05430 [Candidatus Algichlamydia australiensis]|nr:hypothetical protein [Chlamydiales bacterium]